ncbi:MAG TPA: hypothetical protein VLF91_02780 [Candidatus Saccharimonadales bacterium]|nr:hypothetical protein [Candidatus Saccharimonadales bacterium]
MSTKSGSIRGHKFHGDPARFEAIADYVSGHFGREARYIADVAGGQGMLSRYLNKRGYQAEVIDPRGYTLTGVASRAEEYQATMADYYDLIVGLHPDDALRPVVESSVLRPILVIPCCNFWDRSRKLGRDALLQEIESYFTQHEVPYERVSFAFEGPNNIGFVAGL